MTWPLSKLLPWALHVANSDPVYPKMWFYLAKDRILQRHGIHDGYDIQRIEKPCWSCEGTGGLWEPGGCHKCDGSGVWKTVVVLLQRHRLGPYVFHTPRGDAKVRFGRIPDGEAGKVHIEGYVRHERHRHAEEIGLWLMLFYTPMHWRNWMRFYNAYAPHARTPMVLLARSIESVKRIPYHLRHAWWTLRHKLGIEKELPF